MTEHFTREEAVALIQEQIGTATAHLLADRAVDLLNAAVTAKQAEWEAMGAVATVSDLQRDSRAEKAQGLDGATLLYTHALPAQPAELAKQAGAYKGPVKFAPEEIARGNVGIRWVTETKVAGRPTDHDVREFLKETPTARGCHCDECKTFYTPPPSPVAQPAEPKPSSLLTAKELADPEYMRAYIDELYATVRPAEPSVNAELVEALERLTCMGILHESRNGQVGYFYPKNIVALAQSALSRAQAAQPVVAVPDGYVLVGHVDDLGTGAEFMSLELRQFHVDKGSSTPDAFTIAVYAATPLPQQKEGV